MLLPTSRISWFGALALAGLFWVSGTRGCAQDKPNSTAGSNGADSRSSDAEIGWKVIVNGLIEKLASEFKDVDHSNVAFDISPDGEQVVFVAADGNLCVLSIKALRVRQLTNTRGGHFTPTFSRDGKWIAYAESRREDVGASICIRSRDGKQVRRLTDAPGVSDLAPSYSRDGRKLVFMRAHRYRPYSMGGWIWNDYDAYTINANGSELQRITQQEYYSMSSPKLLSDGNEVIYSAFVRSAEERTRSTAFRVDAKGTQVPQPLVGKRSSGGNFFAWASEPDVAPDGNRILFFSDRSHAYHYDLFVAQADGTHATPLNVTKVSRHNKNGVFMPDGKSIVFLAGTESGPGNRPVYSLWQVNVDGSNVRRIADSGLFTDPAHWKPRAPTATSGRGR